MRLFAYFYHFLVCCSMIGLEVLFTSWPVLQGELACLLSLAVRMGPSHACGVHKQEVL